MLGRYEWTSVFLVAKAIFWMITHKIGWHIVYILYVIGIGVAFVCSRWLGSLWFAHNRCLINAKEPVKSLSMISTEFLLNINAGHGDGSTSCHCVCQLEPMLAADGRRKSSSGRCCALVGRRHGTMRARLSAWLRYDAQYSSCIKLSHVI